MEDGRKNNKGVKGRAGRPSKSDEQKLIEKLSPIMPKAYKALEDAIETGQSWAVKMAMEYYHGKPKEKKEVENSGEINISIVRRTIKK